MLSIIICSRDGHLPTEQAENIAATVGCDHELVVIDNSRGEYTLFSAYNEGVRRAKGDVLCFRHDDIMHRSQGWGQVATDLLQDETIGLVGVGGCHFLPSAPAYWSQSPYLSIYNIDNDNGTLREKDVNFYYRDGVADVVAVDGQLFFIPKRLFDRIAFDEQTYEAWHGYDMDISLQVQALGLRAVVTRRMLNEHRWSESKWNDPRTMEPLYRATVRFYNKWQASLPMVRGIDKPQFELDQLNELWRGYANHQNIRRSKPYRLGQKLLSPLKLLK